jgi:hypothetical protein
MRRPTSEPGPSSTARRAVRLLLRTNIFVAFGVVALTWYSATFAGLQPGRSLLVAGAGTLFVYNLDHLRDDRRRTLSGAGRARLAPGLRWSLLGLAALALSTGFALAPLDVLLASLPSGALGLLYGAAWAGRRLKDLPGSKAWIVALAVTWAVAALPLAANGVSLTAIRPDLFLFLLTLTALNAHAFDLRDEEIDRASGAWTWAVKLGPDRARRHMLGAAAVFALLAEGWRRWPSSGLETNDGAEMTLTFACVLAALVATRKKLPREAYGLLFDGLLLVPAAWLLLS